MSWLGIATICEPSWSGSSPPEVGRLKGPERDAVVAAADVLTQLDAIELLRRHRQLSVAEAADVLRVGLHRILKGDR